jgi:hypothetical protein
MVGPPSDEGNCRVCNEASDAAVMFNKARSLRRHHSVSLSFSVKTRLSIRGMTVEMDNFANELATALERESVRE